MMNTVEILKPVYYCGFRSFNVNEKVFFRLLKIFRSFYVSFFSTKVQSKPLREDVFNNYPWNSKFIVIKLSFLSFSSWKIIQLYYFCVIFDLLPFQSTTHPSELKIERINSEKRIRIWKNSFQMVRLELHR